jgi:hypothetical protein
MSFGKISRARGSLSSKAHGFAVGPRSSHPTSIRDGFAQAHERHASRRAQVRERVVQLAMALVLRGDAAVIALQRRADDGVRDVAARSVLDQMNAVRRGVTPAGAAPPHLCSPQTTGWEDARVVNAANFGATAALDNRDGVELSIDPRLAAGDAAQPAAQALFEDEREAAVERCGCGRAGDGRD